MKVYTGLAISILIANYFISLGALRCRLDDGPSEEHLKKIVRSCMRKIGREDNDDFYRNENNRRNDYNRITDRNQPASRSGRNQQVSSDISRENRNEWRHNKFMDRVNSNNTTDSDNAYSYNRGRENQNDQACIVHCFFEELNMLNNDDFPDKHKVLYVLTKDIRDLELKEFYTDTIQECFHFVEMEQGKNKCQVSKFLVNCMAEFARANCENWDDHTFIFT